MKSVYGRDSATRYAPGDKKADINQLIAEYARQQNQRIPSASSGFNAGRVIPKGGYGSTGPLADGDVNIWGKNDILASALGASLDEKDFDDRLAMTRFYNENEIAAMKKQFETDKAYRESLQPKDSGGGFLSKLIGGAKIAVGLGTGNYGLAISGGADLIS